MIYIIHTYTEIAGFLLEYRREEEGYYWQGKVYSTQIFDQTITATLFDPLDFVLLGRIGLYRIPIHPNC